jgi:hypothetical protein
MRFRDILLNYGGLVEAKEVVKQLIPKVCPLHSKEKLIIFPIMMSEKKDKYFFSLSAVSIKARACLLLRLAR